MSARKILPSLLLVGALTTASAIPTAQTTISGDYVEARSCDVYTGPCFANAEMGLTGREAILVWYIRQGGWQGVNLDGLSVIAAVKTDGTLGDVQFQPRPGDAVMIVDSRATAAQQTALVEFARAMAGNVIGNVVTVRATTIQAEIGGCAKSGCASVKAGDLVEVSTRCLGDEDHKCGNEEMFYPPMSEISDAHAAFTEMASFQGKALNLTWANTGQRSAYIGKFTR